MSKRTGNPAVAIRVPERLMSDLETRLEVLSHLEEEPSPGVRPGIATVVRRDLERYYQLIRDELRHLPLERQEILLILDRKSTRLNSSHVAISYAVFCLKKK